jgi:hypothetical protein
MATSKSLKDIIRDEFRKCAQDPVYFMRKYCQIQHPTKGKINFNLYDFQKRTLDDFKDKDYNVILKSRQLGISTLCAGYSLWMLLFSSDKNILVIATKQEVAKNLVTKVRVMHDNLPSWLKGKTIEDNKLSLRFANGSQIKATASVGDSGRSEALSLLIVDEAAFIDNIDAIWASSQQTLATGGKAIILSTPNGTGNFFHKTWVDAEAGSEFNPIKLHWSLHPDRDHSWRDRQDDLLGPKLAAQECDCDFITSGHSVVDGPLLKWYEETHCCDPIEKRGFDGNYSIWEPADYSKDYIVVADVARGDGGDYSAFHVIEVESITQVAEYKGKIGTKEYGNMLVNAATEYNDALLVVENANIGWAAIQPAIDRSYRNLFYSAKDLSVVDVQSQLNNGYDLKEKHQMIPGFTTTSKTRPLIISKLDTLMREKAPIIKSKRLIDELFVFIWKGSRAEAQQGYNDDLVMSFSIGLWVRDTALRLRQEGIELNKRTLNHISKYEGVQTNNNIPQNNPWSMKVKNQDEDLKWLL